MKKNGLPHACAQVFAEKPERIPFFKSGLKIIGLFFPVSTITFYLCPEVHPNENQPSSTLICQQARQAASPLPMKELSKLVRPNILSAAARAAAAEERDRRSAKVLLDANESPFNAPANRYPDPEQRELKKEIAKFTRVPPCCTFLSNGSTEAIDLAFRIFCVPGTDNVAAIDPTCEAYAERAAVNDVEYRRVRLDERFGISAERLLEAADEHTKIIFLCSPNNPTGNLLDPQAVLDTLNAFDGIVVVDEAYIDFAEACSFRYKIAACPRLVVLSTLSTSWASASIRAGVAFAQPDIVELFRRVALPCALGGPTQKAIAETLRKSLEVRKWTKSVIDERDKVVAAFRQLPCCERVYPTDASFFLAKFKGAKKLHAYLSSLGIAVKILPDAALCEDCLRVSIGLPQENSRLIGALRQYAP